MSGNDWSSNVNLMAQMQQQALGHYTIQHGIAGLYPTTVTDGTNHEELEEMRRRQEQAGRRVRLLLVCA